MEHGMSDTSFIKDEIDLIKLQFIDLFGHGKTVEVTRKQAEKVLTNGYAINRFALGGLTGAGREGASAPEYLQEHREGIELYLKPDRATYQYLPWDSGQEEVARLICQVCNPDGTPSWLDCRNILKETLGRAREQGLEVFFDFQCEFYLFHTDEEGRPTTVTHEVAGYYDAGSIDLAESVRRDMILSLEEAGMEVESTHHGLTPGQHCFLIPARCGVEAADYLMTFKSAVRRIAKRHGLHATFMPKPNMSGDGSGLHIGVIVRDPEGRTDRETARAFRSGILKHMREMMVFTNPMVNSYKRLAAERRTVFQPEFPAAVWEKGRDKAVRLVEEQGGDCALQVLFPDPAANPYLALTALLAAGMEGVKQGYELSEEEENPKFPETLGVLLAEFPSNQFALRTFGSEFCRMYGEGKKEEWERFCSYVTDWETREYLYRC